MKTKKNVFKNYILSKINKVIIWHSIMLQINNSIPLIEWTIYNLFESAK